MRRELLNAYLFHSLNEVRHLAKEWQLDYNHELPHEALGFVPPADMLEYTMYLLLTFSIFGWYYNRGSVQKNIHMSSTTLFSLATMFEMSYI